GVRARSPLPRLSYEIANRPSSQAIDRAFAHRLIVDDTLLFRAMQRGMTRKEQLFVEYRKLLSTLVPIVAGITGLPPRLLETRALIHAQQSLGRFDRSSFVRTVRLRPRLHTLLEG